jgi:hypothetical protein
MAELIEITALAQDGKTQVTQVINLDWVVDIRPIDQNWSSVTISDGAHSAPLTVLGTPSVIASYPRLTHKGAGFQA